VTGLREGPDDRLPAPGTSERAVAKDESRHHSTGLHSRSRLNTGGVMISFGEPALMPIAAFA
jgi:hypothetical protein